MHKHQTESKKKKERKIAINYLNLYLKELENEEKTRLKVS